MSKLRQKHLQIQQEWYHTHFKIPRYPKIGRRILNFSNPLRTHFCSVRLFRDFLLIPAWRSTDSSVLTLHISRR